MLRTSLKLCSKGVTLLTRRSILAGMAALPALSACTWGSKELSSIAIGMVTFPGYAPLYLAEKLKLFGNTPVKLLRIESIGDLRSALLAGRIDAYMATFDIYQAIEGRAPIGKLIYAIDESAGADGIAVDSSIASISDLKGKSVGVEPGFPPHFVLTYQLYKAGLTLADLKVVDMPSGDIPSAFVTSRIDAGATYEPFLSTCLTQRKGSKLLASSADTPGLITDFIVASEKAIGEKTAALKAVISGWNRALEQIAKDPNASNAIMGEAFSVPASEMAEFATVVKWLGTDQNAALFRGGEQSLATKRFNEVNEALRLNNPKTYQARSAGSFDTRFLSL